MLPSEEIKDKINIVDLIGEYVPLKKAGINYRALCPFHQEKTPSFMISSTKQIWHCFGCGLGGDIFEFIKQIEVVEFPEALQILATRAGITLERPVASYSAQTDEKKTLYAINDWAAKYYAKVLADSSAAAAARDYLQKRGFKPETVKLWQLGYAPDDFHSFETFIVKKGFQRREVVAAGLLVEKEGDFFDRFRDRIMFPLFDAHGRVVGFTGRILQEAEGVAKYVNSPETAIYSKSSLLYGLHLAKVEIRKLNQAIVVEGNVDVITCHEAGFSNVVGSSGTALTSRQLLSLKRFTGNLSFAFDVDEAGLTATRRAVELALTLGFSVRIIAVPKALAKDPDELIRKDLRLWEQAVEGAMNFLDFYFSAIFANLDLESSIDKKRAVGEFLPLLSLLPDPIDRSHYIQKLASRVGVDNKLLLDLLNKQFAAKHREGPVAGVLPKPNVERKTKQELLERRVLALLLKFADEFGDDWQNLSIEDFSTPVLQEIFSVLDKALRSGSAAPGNLLTDNPKLTPEIELLLFGLENELSYSQEWKLEDLKRQYITELKLFTTKRKMQQLMKQIQQAEQRGRAEEAKSLSSEFNNLIQELSKYHVA